MTDTQPLPDPAALWEAVTRRHPLEGVVYVVRSTGIYCRTDCPARRPAREQVRFFGGPNEAERAGFRACLRCRPGDAPREADDLGRLLALLDDEEGLTLVALAERSGFSVPYIRRLFRRFGMSPKAYVQLRRAERLRERLRAGAPVTEALYDAGYGSSRALYESADETLGMTPGAYRRGGEGVTIRYTSFESSLGPGLVAATSRGVCALRFGEGLLDELKVEFPEAAIAEDAAVLEPFVRAVRAHLAGERRLELPLDVSPSAFQARVWAALQRIPYGETRTYSQIAEAIGAPKAVRAVARACATNPVALAIPCHRVVRAGGALSGYRWGTQRKRALLEAERQHAGAGSSRML